MCKEQKSKLESDLISRQAAIEAFDGVKANEDDYDEYDIGYNDGIDFAVSKLSVLPSAQPEKRTDKHTETHGVCSDCIRGRRDEMHHRIESIREAFCGHYCKWPDLIDDKKVMDDICEACPMGDMVDLMDRFERQHRVALTAGGVKHGFVADEWYRDEFGGVPHADKV